MTGTAGVGVGRGVGSGGGVGIGAMGGGVEIVGGVGTGVGTGIGTGVGTKVGVTKLANNLSNGVISRTGAGVGVTSGRPIRASKSLANGESSGEKPWGTGLAGVITVTGGNVGTMGAIKGGSTTAGAGGCPIGFANIGFANKGETGTTSATELGSGVTGEVSKRLVKIVVWKVLAGDIPGITLLNS